MIFAKIYLCVAKVKNCIRFIIRLQFFSFSLDTAGTDFPFYVILLSLQNERGYIDLDINYHKLEPSVAYQELKPTVLINMDDSHAES